MDEFVFQTNNPVAGLLTGLDAPIAPIETLGTKIPLFVEEISRIADASGSAFELFIPTP